MAESGRPNALAVYTVVLLSDGARYLLLERAATKRFAPGRWTGLGGRVEPDELGDLRAAARREVLEESGLAPEAVPDLTLRRALLQARPGAPLTVLLYFTGTLRAPPPPAGPEGRLVWVAPAEFDRLDIIENTRAVLPLLVADQARDPAGAEPVWLGVACYRPDGALERIVWG